MITIRGMYKLSPNVWGPFFWHTIHIVALGYPNNPTYTDKRSAKEFYESLAFLLPCSVCREHYAQHLQKNPISTFLDKRSDLLKWTILVHNDINTMLGKPKWTETEVIAYYTRLGKRDRSPVWTKDDMKEIDAASFMRGFFVGAFTLGLLAGGVYAITKYDTSK
jgi:hypothetical protein